MKIKDLAEQVRARSELYSKCLRCEAYDMELDAVRSVFALAADTLERQAFEIEQMQKRIRILETGNEILHRELSAKNRIQRAQEG